MEWNYVTHWFSWEASENKNVVENSYIIYNIYNNISIKIHVRRKNRYKDLSPTLTIPEWNQTDSENSFRWIFGILKYSYD